MSTQRITKRTIEAAQRALTDENLKEVILRDDDVRGFQVRIREGGRPTYLLYYRGADSKQHRPKIGDYPSLSPELARDAARNMLARVSLGENPSQVRRQLREAPTIAELITRYLNEYVALHNRMSTAKEIERVLNAKVKPHLGAKKITSLTREEVTSFYRSMRDTPYQANRALSYFSKLLSLACNEWGLRSDNPALKMKKFKETARERFFTEPELKLIGDELNRLQAGGSTLVGPLNAIRILSLTGWRLGDVLNLKWADLSLETQVVHLTSTKTGAQTARLGAVMTAYLTELKETATSEWVVTGQNPKTPLTTNTVESTWKRVRSKIGLTNARLHDFRHTVGTYAGHSGANAFLVRDLLGHKTIAMTSRYVGSEETPLEKMKNEVEKRIDNAMNNDPGKVIRFSVSK